MLKLLFAEIEYNKVFLSFLAIIFILYTFFAVTDTQLLERPEFEIDYWGAIAGLFIYLFFFIIYSMRILEKRIRMLTILPVSVNDISMSRLLLVLIPLIIILIYLVVIHYLLIDTWHEETGAMMMQAGFCFTMIFTVLLIRDIWMIYESKNVLLGITLCGATLLMIFGIIGWIFISGRLIIYDWLGWDYGRTMFFFVALLPAYILYKVFLVRKSFIN